MPKTGGKGSPHPDFGISANLLNRGRGTDYANLITTRPQIFRPSDIPVYLVSKVDVGQEIQSICDRFTSFIKKSVNVNCFILENNLELVMFRVWNYYAMQMSTNIFILQMFFLYF